MLMVNVGSCLGLVRAVPRRLSVEYVVALTIRSSAWAAEKEKAAKRELQSY
jgi:hypothetical protein